ncbi:hypothetical protein GBAR_LOCUS30365 [Geodia barretti]|uniref:Uncharacterized protein n=1 Tax=Geodia barretti TaxID=519541 RepID=A0AA35TWA3_GEOBA|nr:hypothetical protein GBAR_LOCUS30365 [Geodia barretti]
MREGEERLRSGKDVPTFIPRTYLWSRRSATPPKSLPEGAGGNFRQGGGAPPPPVAPGIVDEITREWRQLESSWQQGVAAMNRGRAEPTDKDLLNTRFEDLTVSQLESLHRRTRTVLTCTTPSASHPPLPCRLPGCPLVFLSFDQLQTCDSSTLPLPPYPLIIKKPQPI